MSAVGLREIIQVVTVDADGESGSFHEKPEHPQAYLAR